jgi:glycosyltransferase involved in cell wall biosynthesis
MKVVMKSEASLVALNAQLASGASSYRRAGISAYIVNLLQALSPDGGLRYAVFVGPGRLGEEVPLPLHATRLPTERPPVRILWEQAILPSLLRRLGVDLLHAPAFVGPLLSPTPQVITVHDLSFYRFPEYFRRGNRFYLRQFTGRSCRRAAAVIAVSHFTAREVTALLGVPPERVHVIYHGLSPRFRPLPTAEVERFREAAGLPRRFILYLGTLEPRKNLLTLLRAFARLPDPELHLVLAGGKGWLYEEIFAEVEALDLGGRVHFPGYVPMETQALWYNAACVFAYISRYEGFGLPVLEALACGTPTLTGNTTSLPEAGGEAALTVPPEDVEAVSAGLHRLLNDDALRDACRVRGLQHAAGFTWEETARRTAALYRRVIQGEVSTA